MADSGDRPVRSRGRRILHLVARPLAMRPAVVVCLVCSIPELAESQSNEWRVSATSSVSIGGEASGPASPIFGVLGLARLSTGSIVVADRAQRLLLFDASGRYVRALGREGGGPGEFTRIGGIQVLPNDTVLVFDNGNRRISYFTVDEGFRRSVTLPDGNAARIVGAFPDGTVVGARVSDWDAGNGPTSADDPVHWMQMELQLIRSNAAGQILSILGTFPDPAITIPIGGGRRMAAMMGGPQSPVPWTSVALSGSKLYVTTGEDFEIMVYPPTGVSPTRMRRTDYETRPLMESDVVPFFSGGSRVSDRLGVEWDRLQWNIPRGWTVTAISSVLVDTEGNVWAEEGPWVSGRARAWSVFNASGRHVAQVVMPSRFRPFEIGGESILGIWTDELDVEYVQIRALNRVSR